MHDRVDLDEFIFFILLLIELCILPFATIALIVVVVMEAMGI